MLLETEYALGVKIEYRPGLGVFTGPAGEVRVESDVNFNPGLGRTVLPWNSLDIFSARMIGYVQAPATGIRYFFFLRNGGHRVYINDVLVDEQHTGNYRAIALGFSTAKNAE